MRPARRLALVLTCVVLAAGCATGSGLRRVAVASENIAITLESVQLTADALEAGKVITTAQRDALSPGIIKLAQADAALARAVVAGDTGTVRGQLVAMIGLLDELATIAKPWGPEGQARWRLALDAVRAVLLVVSTGVTQ